MGAECHIQYRRKQRWLAHSAAMDTGGINHNGATQAGVEGRQAQAAVWGQRGVYVLPVRRSEEEGLSLNCDSSTSSGPRESSCDWMKASSVRMGAPAGGTGAAVMEPPRLVSEEPTGRRSP